MFASAPGTTVLNDVGTRRDQSDPVVHTRALSTEPLGLGIGVEAGIAAHVSLSSLNGFGLWRRPCWTGGLWLMARDRARSSVG